MSPPVVQWCREHPTGIEVGPGGARIHLVQEDSGPAIGATAARWMRQRLAG